MEVTILANQRRPGVGRRPVSENRRAWLPQQARFCPVLEDASRSGYLVYPPLAPDEAFQVRLLPQGIFRLSLLADPGGSAGLRPLFVMDVTPSAGTGGVDAYDLRFTEEGSGLDAASAQEIVDTMVTNVNSPPGGIGLRGAFDFVTPEGWDTLYVGLLNEVQRPTVPTLTARVETDWYAQPTEFRYVLQPGDVLSASGEAPIGQVLFVPRTEVTLRHGEPSDAAAFGERQRAYWTERSAQERATNFGATYSYHYRDIQKARRTEAEG
ncbi:MAG: hypothetical protein WD058_06645 [Dehalococcoidia bacterium]